MRIEIYERAFGKVIETLEFDDMEAFRFYWQRQCNGADYGWREQGPVAKVEG